jgi:hypothetical protein
MPLRGYGRLLKVLVYLRQPDLLVRNFMSNRFDLIPHRGKMSLCPIRGRDISFGKRVTFGPVKWIGLTIQKLIAGFIEILNPF